MVYRRFEAALARVEALKKAGIWPVYFRVPGGWALSYDPPGPVNALDAHGYVTLGTDTMSDG